MSPIIPHFASECLDDLGEKSEKSWPKINEEYLIKETVNIVLQINGRKKSIIISKKNVDKDTLTNEIKTNTQYNKYLENKKIKRIIYVKDRLINLIIE